MSPCELNKKILLTNHDQIQVQDVALEIPGGQQNTTLAWNKKTPSPKYQANSWWQHTFDMQRVFRLEETRLGSPRQDRLDAGIGCNTTWTSWYRTYHNSCNNNPQEDKSKKKNMKWLHTKLKTNVMATERSVGPKICRVASVDAIPINKCITP